MLKTIVLLAGVLLVLGGCEAFQSFTATPAGQDALMQGAEAAATAIGVAFRRSPASFSASTQLRSR